MSKKIFSKKEAILFGWQTTKSNLGFWIGVLILTFAISFIPDVFKFFLPKNIWAITALLLIFNFAFAAVLMLGLCKIELDFCDQKKPNIEDLFSQYPLALSYIAASIVSTFIAYGSMIVLMVPIFFLFTFFSQLPYSFIYGAAAFSLILLPVIPMGILMIKFLFIGYFIVDRGSGPWEALKQSWKITDGVVIDLLIFSFVLFAIQILGFLCLIVGLFVSIPVSLLAIAFVYRKLLSQADVLSQVSDSQSVVS